MWGPAREGENMWEREWRAPVARLAFVREMASMKREGCRKGVQGGVVVEDEGISWLSSSLLFLFSQ